MWAVWDNSEPDREDFSAAEVFFYFLGIHYELWPVSFAQVDDTEDESDESGDDSEEEIVEEEDEDEEVLDEEMEAI